MDSYRRRPRWSVLGLGSSLTGLALIGLALWPVQALAGEGNPNYLGILSSSAPTGYTPSPSSYGVGSQLTFQFSVKNLTPEQQSMTLQLRLNHILTYNGLNVADGQPGVANGAIVDGNFNEQLSTQAADAGPTSVPFTIAPGATQVVSMSRALPACGYFQVDVVKAGVSSPRSLVGFTIRVLGCTATVPSPSASPTGSPSPSPGVTPSPPAGGTVSGGTAGTGGVSGATAAAPVGVPLAETGANPPEFLVGALLLGLGLIVLGARALARMRRRRI